MSLMPFLGLFLCSCENPIGKRHSQCRCGRYHDHTYVDCLCNRRGNYEQREQHPHAVGFVVMHRSRRPVGRLQGATRPQGRWNRHRHRRTQGEEQDCQRTDVPDRLGPMSVAVGCVNRYCLRQQVTPSSWSIPVMERRTPTLCL